MITSLKMRAVSRETVKPEPVVIGIDSLHAKHYMKFSSCLRVKQQEADNYCKRIEEKKARDKEVMDNKGLQALIRQHSHVVCK